MQTQRQTVILISPWKTWLGAALEQDLRRGGFDVEAVPSGARAIVAARERLPDAFMFVEGQPSGWLGAVGRDPALRPIPLVGVTASDPERPRFIPFLPLLRCDAWVQAAALGSLEDGAATMAVRRAIFRGRLPPPSRVERLGVWLRRLALVLLLVLFAAAMWNAFGVLGGRRVGSWTLVALMFVGLLSFPAGELGTRLARGLPPSLRAHHWLLIGFLAGSGAVLALIAALGAFPA